MPCSTRGSAMAALDAALDAAVAPRRRRRLSNIFWAAAAWIAVVVLAAILANLLPIPSPTEMDMLARRMPPDARHWLGRSEEHTSELQSRSDLVCRLLLAKKKK